MGDGWETRRSRSKGHTDWVVIKLYVFDVIERFFVVLRLCDTEVYQDILTMQRSTLRTSWETTLRALNCVPFILKK